MMTRKTPMPEAPVLLSGMVSAVVPALVAGILLGLVFFGGLWWTVRMGLASPQPALWFLGSFLVRTAIAVAGFYFVAQGNWRRLVACLSGFLLARIATAWLTRETKTPEQGIL